MSTPDQLLRDAALQVGLDDPGAGAFLSGDKDIARLRSFLDLAGRELVPRYHWQSLTRRFAFGAEDGVPNTAEDYTSFRFPNDLSSFLNFTAHEVGTGNRIFGSVPESQWTANQWIATGSYYQYRVAANRIDVAPQLPANIRIAISYKTDNWVQAAADENVGRDGVRSGDDVFRLDYTLLLKLVIAKYSLWKAEASAPAYMDEYEKHYRRVKSKDRPSPVIFLGGDYRRDTEFAVIGSSRGGPAPTGPVEPPVTPPQPGEPVTIGWRAWDADNSPGHGQWTSVDLATGMSRVVTMRTDTDTNGLQIRVPLGFSLMIRNEVIGGFDADNQNWTPSGGQPNPDSDNTAPAMAADSSFRYWTRNALAENVPLRYSLIAERV